ncbi:hypothetical protein D3C87_2106750 [compost metagenome]
MAVDKLQEEGGAYVHPLEAALVVCGYADYSHHFHDHHFLLAAYRFPGRCAAY